MNRSYSSVFSRSFQKVAMMKLWELDSAAKINDLRIQLLNNLTMVRGRRRVHYLIRINSRYNIRFTWKNCNAHNVKIIS